MSIDDQSSHWSNRWIWILVPCICTLLPFSTPIRLGEMAGSGPDVVSSVWAMWWFQEASLLEVLGGKSTLFNFPWGGSGTILSPSSAIVWGVLYTVFGPAWATTLCNLWLINATMLSLVWLGRSFGFSRLACGAMAIMCILPRYMVFTLGETGVVGVAALPLILGLVALKKMEMSTDWRWMIVLIGCIGFQAIENPYLVLVLPLAVLLSALYFRNRRYWISLVFGSIGMLATIWLFRQSSGSYESIRPSGFTELFGLYFPAVEREWARSSLLDMINPIRVLWPAGSMDSIHIQGREYLGCAGIIAAVYGLRDKSMWIWGAFSILGLVLVTGSDWGGLPSPFGLLNSLANAVVRPFTQPSRYFILFIIGASVLVGRSVHHHRWGHWIWAGLLLESLTLGGASLRMPSTEVPSFDCTSEPLLNGPTLTWPWDGADDEWYESALQSRLFQMTHGQPGATIGTGSWSLEGAVFPGKRLRDIGWRKSMNQSGNLDVDTIRSWGFKHVIIDKRSGPLMTRIGRDSSFQDSTIQMECPNVLILDL